jgi:hypothetical protein
LPVRRAGFRACAGANFRQVRALASRASVREFREELSHGESPTGISAGWLELSLHL